MTASADILSDLEEQLRDKRRQREVLLGQLSLLDVSLDKYDSLITNIDSDALSIISTINNAIIPVKQAYDARIAAGCRSNLSWQLIDSWSPPLIFFGVGVQSSYYQYEVKKNPDTYSFTPNRGLKYYQKPTNRDYGANIIVSFHGSVSTGSSVISIIDGNSISSLIQTNDRIIDNIDNPIYFSSTNIPYVTGFGTTEAVGIVTTLVGGISTGSTIFAHYGSGISTIGVSTGMSLESVGIVAASIVGFGTTAFNISFFDENGNFVTTEQACNSVILDSPASQGINEATFTVGIATQVPAIFISTSSLGIDTNVYLNVLRLGDVNVEFDYTQNPSEPLSIGIMDQSKIGVGHSIIFDSSGKPSSTQSWIPSQSYINPSTNEIVNPEPSVGAGRREYYIGTLEWPIIRKAVNVGLSTFYYYDYAPEGTKILLSSPSIGTTASGIGYTGKDSSGINPNGSICQQLAQDINNAIDNMNNVISSNTSRIDPLINATKSLRSNRDRKELQAWSILQAIGSITEDIKRLEVDVESLRNLDFSPYETS
jgi:hypothetical protein